MRVNTLQARLDADVNDDPFDLELSPTSPNPLSSSCVQMAQITEEQDCEASNEVSHIFKTTDK